MLVLEKAPKGLRGGNTHYSGGLFRFAFHTAEELKPIVPDAERKLPGFAEIETPSSRARVSEVEEIARRELTARELEAWDLVEMQDYSAAEAGLAMGCTDAAVRSLLPRARARLVSVLEGN